MPTPENLDLMLTLTLIVSFDWACTVGDVKGAFTQSAEGMRTEPLYVKLPKGGLPLDHQNVRLARLTRELYGLVTGPAAWRATLLGSAQTA
eukprot:3659380-Amphidinium_carterae.1